MDEGALRGIRIVDAGGSVASMVAAMVLAEAGADVVLVEPPGGSRWRSEPGWRTWNRSKRSVVLDLDEAAGRDELDVLLDEADVLVHSYGPTAAAERAFTDEALCLRHPSLIVSSVLGWPMNHERADDPVDDHLVLARLGICDEQMGTREGPIFVRFPLGTWPAAWLATCGILARLLLRRRTGETGPAHTSLAQGALIPIMMHWSRAEHPSESLRIGMPKDNMRASLFECADGRWIHTMPPPPDDTPLMKEVLAEMGPEAVAAANAAAGDGMPGFENWGANIAAFRRRSADEWLQNHWDHDIPAQEAAPYGRILADPQARTNHYSIEIDDPDLGPITVPGHPITLDPPAQVRCLAPGLGDAGDVRSAWSPRPPSEAPIEEVTEGGPLSGLKVLDFGNFLAGPLGPMLLADLGATVVKVEAATGDPMRFADWPFAGCQRGKRSVALDIKDPASRPALAALLKWADVVHHNLRMPAATRLGLDADAVRAVNPEVVFCHVSSYGPLGPRADWPDYDQLFQAACGWEVLGAGDGNPPMWHRFGFMDHLCAMSSAAATLIALYQRGRDGRGRNVAASLLGAGALTNADTHVGSDGQPAPVPTLDPAQTRLHPGVAIMEAQDGWVAVAARTDHQVAALCAATNVGHPDEVAIAVSTLPTAEVLAALEANAVPASAVNLDQRGPFFDDAANIASGIVATYIHEDWGRLEQPGAPWFLGDRNVPPHLAPPTLGAHTVEVLLEVGVDQPSVDALLVDGVAVAR